MTTTAEIRLSNDHLCPVTAEDEGPAEALDGTILIHAEQWDAEEAIAEVREEQSDRRLELWREDR